LTHRWMEAVEERKAMAAQGIKVVYRCRLTKLNWTH
jgi:hypothetical protein